MSTFRHRIQLANPIGSRDGTLNADSKMKNMVVENVEGDLVALKRPGVTKTTELPPGLAQGLFSLNGTAYAIVDDKLYGPFSPGGGGTGSNGWVKIPTDTIAFSLSRRVLKIGVQLVYLDTDTHKTWFSSDATNWTSADWVGTVYPKGDQGYLNGAMYLWNSDSATNKLLTAATSDFITWTMLEDQDYFSDFRYNYTVTHNGVIISFNGGTGLSPKTYSTVDGITWSEPVITQLPSYVYGGKFISYNGALYAIPYGSYIYDKAVYKSIDNGVTWAQITSDWGVTSQKLVSCIVTSEGLLAVFQDKETWTSADGITWTKKNYTLPSGSGVMNFGQLVSIGYDLFLVGCEMSSKNVFKLVDSSAPVGASL